jgi:membrane fusion protein, multidrug efflux system
VNLGEQLDVGKGIVSLQSLTPVFVDFSLPQQDLAQFKTGLVVRSFPMPIPTKQFDGELTAINPDLDGHAQRALRATFENTDNCCVRECSCASR